MDHKLHTDPRSVRSGSVLSSVPCDRISIDEAAKLSPAFREMARAAQEAGVAVENLTYTEKVDLIERRRAFEAMTFRDAQMARYADHQVAIRIFEDRVRSALALVLVLGSVGGVIGGVFADVRVAELSQYLAPLTGLTGIAIGYFFGRSKAERE